MMKKHFLLGCLCLSLSSLAVAESTLPDIKEGQWELSFKYDTASMPTPMPSVTYSTKKCLSQKTAAEPRTFLETNDCDISDLNQQSHQLSWSMRCQQQTKEMQGSGKVDYQQESLNAIFNLTMPTENAGAMTTTTQINGRYLGACQ